MQAAAPAAAREESPLLRCLSQLNDDVFTSYLLPKLIEQGSAAAVARTCSQLCELCQDSVQHLDLTKNLQNRNPCIEPQLANQLIIAFTNCTSLDLTWPSFSIHDVYKNISPLLAGFPGLNSINIKLQHAGEDGSLDPVLGLLHLHATALRCLCLQLVSSWEKHRMTWEALGKMDKLTKLQLSFGQKVEKTGTHLDLAQLTGLTKLQSLIIDAPGAMENSQDSAVMQEAVQNFPGCLTSLTQLRVSLDVLYNISSVGQCTNLCDLQLQIGKDSLPNPEGLSALECRALAQLTHLTRLNIDVNADPIEPTEANEFYGVLRQLTRLRRVGALFWGPCAIPVLQSLTQLTAVDGMWSTLQEPTTVDIIGLVCPHIRELGETRQPPFDAFPNLTCVSFCVQSVASMQSLVSNCTALQKLALTDLAVDYVTSSNDASGVSVFKSLAQLQHLTHLDLAPGNDACFVAFATAAAAVHTPKLRCLHVHGPLTFYALMQLQGVHGLQELTVHMSAKKGGKGSFSAKAVRMLLVSLAAVPKVCLVLCAQEQMGVVAAARQWAARMELPMPAVVKVSLAHTR